MVAAHCYIFSNYVSFPDKRHFRSLAESLRVPIARFMTWINHDNFTLYADYYSDNLENAWLYIYVFLNVIVGIVSVATFEYLAKLAKKSN